MVKYLIILLSLLSLHCSANDNFWSLSVEWLKGSLPDNSQLEFNKASIKFKGCRQKDYQLLLTQNINSHLYLETSVGYAYGKLSWGAHSQKVSVKEWSLVPRYQLSEKLDVGLGMIVQSAPEFKTSQDTQLDLPKNSTWILSTRFKSLSDQHYFEVAVSSQQWEASSATGNWFARGLADNKLNVSYRAIF
ncbi:MAG: hypothetical protein ACI88A_000159 [Paraglaciecola sp.]|jgi:hypothetical protein